MSKRRATSQQDIRRKRYKVASGIIDPSTSGVYITCPRGKEKRCVDEMLRFFEEKLDEYGIKPLDEEADEAEPEHEEEDKEEAGQEDEQEISIEDSIKAELNEIKKGNKKSKNAKNNGSKSSKLILSIPLGQECLVFIKFRKPIDPEEFIHRIFVDLSNCDIKKTRYALKMTPVQQSCSATKEELMKLAKSVMERHFHQGQDIQKRGLKYAININKRSFTAMEKMDMINSIAECMTHDYDHAVDLKEFDKLIMVECFKSNIGMSVLDDYGKFYKYNIDQLFAKKKLLNSVPSRVKNTESSHQVAENTETARGSTEKQ